jgi:hypothetical protein
LQGEGAVCGGDFIGRNVFVAGDRIGDRLGSGCVRRTMFRYAGRYDLEFRDLFARACCDNGAELAADWWRMARIVGYERPTSPRSAS